MNMQPARIFAVVVLFIYLPVFQTAGWRWLHTEQYAHGVFIFPITALLLVVKRREIGACSLRPSGWGLWILGLGLAVQVASHYLNFEFFSVLSLLPVMAGAVLLFHGTELWKVVQFPVLFLGFAANLPGAVLSIPSRWIQGISATGAAFLTRLVGFTVMQHGNLLDVPGMTLEVADACSGFRKLTALIVFSALYGYLYRISNVRRALLVVAVVPIAIAVNIARLFVLIAAASLAGAKAEAFLHNPAEFAVLATAFLLTVRTGKVLLHGKPKCGGSSLAEGRWYQLPPNNRPLSTKMYWTRILPILAVLLTVLALAANLSLPPGTMRRPERRDVTVFPIRIGEWVGGPNRPLDLETQKQLATASVLDRIYTNRRGRAINLLIVSSMDPEDAHSPEACLPSRGWVPRQTQTTTIDGQLVPVDTMTKMGEAMDVLFWWDILLDKNANFLSRIEAFRESFRGQGSVMVRLTTVSGSASAVEQREFARILLPAMREWKSAAPVLQGP